MRRFVERLHTKYLRGTLGVRQHANLLPVIESLIPPGTMSMLDIGCGDGKFASMLMRARPGLAVTGAEVVPREGCLIPCTAYGGGRLPFADGQFDCVMLINVLHHTDDPAGLLREAMRVSRAGIVIKDHYANSRFDHVSLVAMEALGNMFRGIHQTFRFFSEPQWAALFAELGLKQERCVTRFPIYTKLIDLFAARNLHFCAFLTRAAHE